MLNTEQQQKNEGAEEKKSVRTENVAEKICREKCPTPAELIEEDKPYFHTHTAMTYSSYERIIANSLPIARSLQCILLLLLMMMHRNGSLSLYDSIPRCAVHAFHRT